MGARYNSLPTGLALGFLFHTIQPGIEAAEACFSESIRVFSARDASHLQPELEKNAPHFSNIKFI